MKYCVNARQSETVLQDAEEIWVAENDYKIILDFIEKYPEKTIILEQKYLGNIPEETLQMYNEKLNNFILDVRNAEDIVYLNTKNIKSFWHYPITSYVDLRTIITYNPCYLFLGEPLTFDLENVKKITEIPLRLCPNIAYVPYLKRENGVYGQWIRPENVQLYEPYVDAFQFFSDNLKKEKTLLKIYKQGTWPGNLNLLIDNLNYNIDNRGIPDELIQQRLNCGQRCMKDSSCRACLNGFKFAENIEKLHLADKKIREQKKAEN